MQKTMNPCRLCNSKKTDAFITDKGTKREKLYHHCRECDFIFADERFILSPDEEEKRYVHHNNTIENEGYVMMFKNFIKTAIADEFLTAEKILDFGCGPSPVFAEIMRQNGKTVDIFDPFYHKNDDIFNKAYDLITSTEVFEHVKYPLVSFQSLYKLIKTGGTLAIMTKFHSGIQDFENWWYRRDVTHISFFNTKTVQKVAELTNFKRLRSDETSFFVLQK